MAEQENLVEVLTDLRSLIQKQTSLKFAFARGLVYGLGTVVGATVLIGVLGWFLGGVFDDPEDVPIIGDAIEESR